LSGLRGGVYVAGSKIVNSHRLKLFCDNNPKIGRPIRRLAEKNRIAIMTAPRRIVIAAPAVVRAGVNIMDEIAASVPRHLPRDLRDDVIQNIWIAVIERKLKREDIPTRAYEFIRAEWNCPGEC
jgi:hypothetical protein